MTQDPRDDRRHHLAFATPAERAALRPRSPRKQPVQARSRELVEVILEGAARVFEERGYAAATTDAIAERAGVSIGSLYQYFPNKDALAVALMERHGEAGVRWVAPVLERLSRERPPLADGLRWLVDAFVSPHLERPALHDALADGADVPPVFRVRRRTLTRALAQPLSAWLEHVLPESARAPTVASVIAASIEGLAHGLTAAPAELEAVGDPAAEIHALLLSYALGRTSR